MLNGLTPSSTGQFSAGDNEAVVTPATPAVRQRDADLIMDALVREYLSAPPPVIQPALRAVA
jgi:hypothetical protein